MTFKYLPQPNAFTGFFVSSFHPGRDLLPRELSHEHHHLWAKPHLQNMAHSKKCKVQVHRIILLTRNLLATCSSTFLFTHGQLDRAALENVQSGYEDMSQGQQLLKLSRKPVPVCDHLFSKKLFPCVQMESLTNLCPFSHVTESY